MRSLIYETWVTGSKHKYATRIVSLEEMKQGVNKSKGNDGIQRHDSECMQGRERRT